MPKKHTTKGNGLLQRVVQFWRRSYDPSSSLMKNPPRVSGGREAEPRISAMPSRKREAVKLVSHHKAKRVARREPVEVMCRICPLNSRHQETCVVADDQEHVRLTPPSNFRQCNIAQSQVESVYKFTHVFDEDDGQTAVFERAALDLVKYAITGNSALLFTYGVSGSGKTYTMTGDTQGDKQGILPRSLDVLFNSLPNLAERCVFQSNHKNGFVILPEREASMCRKMTRVRPSGSIEGINGSDEKKRVSGAQSEFVYSVFVTYIEVYNDSCFDLLSDPVRQRDGRQKLLPRDVRLGENNSIYVDGCMEMEVRSSEDALEQFFRGQERRTIADTLLNKQSSRSHSIFNIRIVSAPCEPGTSQPSDVLAKIRISQLSLVDLAGSERSSRTFHTGSRLNEAGRINHSLLALRQCFDKLRLNQLAGSQQVPVPYRDTKLTYLFKNVFEGAGKVRMIICLNPQPEDYNENMGVVTFGELSQEVVITRKEEPPAIADSGDGVKNALNHHRMNEAESAAREGSSHDTATIFEVKTSDDVTSLSKLKTYFTAKHSETKKKLAELERREQECETELRKVLHKYDQSMNNQERLKLELEESNRSVVKLNCQIRTLKNENLALKNRLRRRDVQIAEEAEQSRLKEADYIRKLREEQDKMQMVEAVVAPPTGRMNVTLRRPQREATNRHHGLRSKASDDASCTSESSNGSKRDYRGPLHSTPKMGCRVGELGAFRRRSKSENIGGISSRTHAALPPHMQRAALRTRRVAARVIKTSD